MKTNDALDILTKLVAGHSEAYTRMEKSEKGVIATYYQGRRDEANVIEKAIKTLRDTNETN